MSLDLFALECFVAVVQTGSFTKASLTLNRTQSAISQQMLKLESSLNKKLLIRGKDLSLTPEGETLYSYAKQIDALHRQALLQFQRDDVQGELKFGLPEEFAAIFLESVLTEFYQLHPQVSIHIECDLSLNLLEKFHRYEFDLILLKDPDLQRLQPSQEIWSEKLEWVASKLIPQHLNPEQEIPLILSPPPCVYRSRALSALNARQMASRVVFTSSSYHSKIAATKAGLGITVLPHSMIPPYLSIVHDLNLPPLHDTHVTLLKHTSNPLTNTFERFMLKKLKH